jgi:hypothetical protein
MNLNTLLSEIGKSPNEQGRVAMDNELFHSYLLNEIQIYQAIHLLVN